MHNTLRETTSCAWTSRYFYRSFTNARLLWFVSHSNDMTSCQSSWAENVSCNVAPFFYHITTVWWYNILYRIPCIRQATFFDFKGKRTWCYIKRFIYPRILYLPRPAAEVNILFLGKQVLVFIELLCMVHQGFCI